MSEIHGATGSYVVHALDPAELDEFEAHLAVCPTCSQEVVEFCETAAQLSLLAAAPAPPPALRDSVLASIAEVRPLPPLEEPAEPARSTEALADEVVLDELALRRAARRTRVLTLAVAAVTVVALALGGVVFSLVQQRQAPVAAAQVDPSLLAAKDATIHSVTLKNGAQASFVDSKSQNRAVFVSGELPSPGTGNVYHLWTLKGKDIVRPDNTLEGGTGKTQVFAGPVADSTQLAVNIEPAGSSPQAPTTPVLASATI
jgi:anti-sigma-K factor RskA